MNKASLCIVAGFLPLITITALSFLDGNFSLFSDYVSKLGVGQYGVIFNASLVIAAVLSAPFLANIRKGPVSYMFIGATAALAGVGLFPASDSLHWYFAAAFFLLMFASILVVGVTSKGMARASVVVGLAGFAGLAVLTPPVEA